MNKTNQTLMTVGLIMIGMMLGSGLGAAFGSVAIGLPAGTALGALAAVMLNLRHRQS